MTPKERKSHRKERFIALLNEKYGGHQASLASAADIAATLVSRYISGTKGIGEDMVSKIESNTGYSGWFNQEVSNLEDAPELRPFKNVPVVGTVQGGDDGYLTDFEYPVGHGDGCISYPARDANSYALRVRGDSMRPRIKNGEFIVVEPNHVAQPGDDVVVCLGDGRKMVKELLYTRDGEVTLGSINSDHANITVASDQIEKMHYVAAIIPRGAFYKPTENI